MTSTLEIRDLHANVGDREILRGIDLTVPGGEVHVVMGPNGCGKSTLSHVLMGKHGYTVTGGSVSLDGADLLAMATWERAKAGLFLAMQYPTEVPGVAVEDMLTAALGSASRERMCEEAEKIGFDERFLSRPLNVDLSGGEKKRNETMQLGVLAPKIAVLDEIDSGLDIDALRAVSRRVEALTTEIGLGVLAITHYRRLLTELSPDRIHVLVKGRIVASGGPELADELERTGYAEYVGADEVASSGSRPLDDPFADPLA